MRTLLRTLLACALLIGGLGQDWASFPAPAQAHAPCCCGCCGGAQDHCPCPKPETPQGPAQNDCGTRSTPLSTPLALLQRAAQSDIRRSEPRPTLLARADQAPIAPEKVATVGLSRGRDPDLGRHLARLSLLRI